VRLLGAALVLGGAACGSGGGSAQAPTGAPVATAAQDPRPRGAANGSPLQTASAAGEEKPTAPSTARPAGPFNVVLILVDSMRADMPWAGYPRPIAPVLTELEKQCTSYTRAYSISSVTAKSIGGLLGAKYPSTLKRNGFFDTTYSRDNVFFPELLADRKITVLGAHAHTYMGGPGNKGLDQGFKAWRLVKGLTYDMRHDRDVTSQKLTPLAIEMLGTVPADSNFFLYAHYMDPHHDYVAHKEAPDFGKKARDIYDQEVFYTDLWIGKLLDHLKAQPYWEKTVVIVSADHGEAFGEHGQYRHAFEIWNSLTHVPLFIRVPGGNARRIEVPRSHIDLPATILELMGVEQNADYPGKSLVPELYGAAPEARPVLLDLPADNSNPERRAVIDGRYKLLVFGSDQRFDLYDLENDPGELKNLARDDPETLARMKALYEKTWGKIARIKPL
jgi:choline-sulfatase